MNDIQKLLTLSDAFCQQAKMAEATLSTRMLGSGVRLRLLRQGNLNIGLKTCEKAIKYLRDNWVFETPFPEFSTEQNSSEVVFPPSSPEAGVLGGDGCTPATTLNMEAGS